MKLLLFLTALTSSLHILLAEETRLLDLDPNDAQQIIEKQDQTLKYAPKIASNVPSVRYVGNEPQQIVEDIYLAKQYHGQDGLGGYIYGYSVPDIAKNEKKVAGGDLRGAYNYINGDGQEIKVEYWDDGTGFHQVDNVAKILPKQVEDSPEVKAAKEAFLKRWHEEAERNKHPITNPNQYDNHAQQFTPQSNQSPFSQPGHAQQFGNQYQYPQSSPFAQQNQPFQNAGQFPQGGQSPFNSFPGQGQQPFLGQHQAANQFQPQPVQNQFDYYGQSSQNNAAFAQPQQSKRYGLEETTSPPKGFFSSYDYQVGVNTQKQGNFGPQGGVSGYQYPK